MEELLEKLFGVYSGSDYLAFIIIGLAAQLLVKLIFYLKKHEMPDFSWHTWINNNIVDVVKAFLINAVGGFLLLRFTNDIVNSLLVKLGIVLPKIGDIMFYAVLLGAAIQWWLHKKDQNITLEKTLEKLGK